MMEKIKEVTHDEERAFYGSKDISFDEVNISGPTDGESAFKECSNIEVSNSKLNLRYPFWHDTNLRIFNSSFAQTARAPLWYSKHVNIEKAVCYGVKAVRECEDVSINNSTFVSIEFGWKSKKITISNTYIDSMYAFFESSDVTLDNVNFKGKYSFQYNKNLTIRNSILDTKDAFWHTKDVTVENCTVKGEYLGWYSENVTFINCKISGTQPLCYAKNVKFVNCTFENCDLAFEYSEINGTILGTIDSIKNPLKGHVFITKIPKIIVDEFDKSEGNFKIEETH